MRQFLKFAPLAGAALLVAACGGASTNNTAGATDAGNVVTNEAPTMAPDMNAGMPADNNAMAAPAAPADANAAAPAANGAAGNGM